MSNPHSFWCDRCKRVHHGGRKECCPRRGGSLLALLAAVMLTGCATFRHPAPIGEPSPVACYGAQRTKEAWEAFVRPYIEATLAAQEAFSCRAPPEPQPLTPKECSR